MRGNATEPASLRTPTIPSILHQTWSTDRLPEGLKRAVSSWRRLQPAWQYRFYTDRDNKQLVRSGYEWLAAFYASCSPIQRADLARYVYMHASGGVYADIDVELLQRLRPLLQKQRRKGVGVILGQEPLAHAVLIERRERMVCNAVLASTPGHPFWLALLRHIVANARPHTDPPGSTGPRMLERFFLSWHRQHREDATERVVVLPPDAFFPTWDPMQTNTLRQKCAKGVSASLGRGAARVCARLRQEGFRPTVPSDGSAFTNHLWVHTWIPGLSKVDRRQTFRVKRLN